MRRILSLFLLLLVLSACAAPPEVPAQTPESPEITAPEDQSPAGTSVPDEPADHVLLTLDAPLADGRTLTLEAFGRVVDEYSAGVREVRVYDGETLLQTIFAQEGNMAFWGDGDLLPGESVSEYTSCWEPEVCMEAVDLNFDGNTDLGLFALRANNTIPYHYWIWDAEQYQYAFTLQGVSADPGAEELRTAFRISPYQYETDIFKLDKTGELVLDHVEIEDWELSGLDDRAAHETWVPNPEQRLSPGASDWSYHDLLLVRRELPIREIQEDGCISNFTEIWELKDSQLQLTSREEFTYEKQP